MTMGSACIDVIAGDMNDTPEQTCVRAMENIHQIMAPIAPTCITAQAARVIDMILASTDGAEILKGVYANSEYHEDRTSQLRASSARMPANAQGT